LQDVLLVVERQSDVERDIGDVVGPEEPVKHDGEVDGGRHRCRERHHGGTTSSRHLTASTGRRFQQRTEVLGGQSCIFHHLTAEREVASPHQHHVHFLLSEALAVVVGYSPPHPANLPGRVLVQTVDQTSGSGQLELFQDVAFAVGELQRARSGRLVRNVERKIQILLVEAEPSSCDHIVFVLIVRNELVVVLQHQRGPLGEERRIICADGTVR
jgi:hypothetical protein